MAMTRKARAATRTTIFSAALRRSSMESGKVESLARLVPVDASQGLPGDEPETCRKSLQ